MTAYIPGINPGVGGQDGVDEAVLRALRPVILRYCRARLSHHAADDAAQEVCLALMSARRGRPDYLSAGRTVTAYAFGIAQHKVADAMRAAARLAAPFPGLPDIADDRPGPEETVLARRLFGCGSMAAGQSWRHGIL